MVAAPPPRQPQHQTAGQLKDGAFPKAGAGAGGTPKKKAQTADKLKDGTEICRNWNLGKCSDPCPQGRKHVCNAVSKKGGRICGLRNHTSEQCRGAERGQ